MPWHGNTPAPEATGAAADTLAELGIEDGVKAVKADFTQPHIRIRARTIGYERTPVTAQLQPLDDFPHNRMVRAGHRQSIEGDVPIERLELAVHVLDGLEVVEMLRIDVRHDADLRRDLHESS